eukprot:1310419-Prymnesium_polylepis.1
MALLKLTLAIRVTTASGCTPCAFIRPTNGCAVAKHVRLKPTLFQLSKDRAHPLPLPGAAARLQDQLVFLHGPQLADLRKQQGELITSATLLQRREQLAAARHCGSWAFCGRCAAASWPRPTQSACHTQQAQPRTRHAARQRRRKDMAAAAARRGHTTAIEEET